MPVTESAEFNFADRYGMRSSSRWIVFALLFAGLGVIWVVWAGVHHANPEIRATLISFAPINEKSISIRYEVIRRNPSEKVSCTLIARDFDKNIVGQIEDQIPMGETTREVVIPTRVNAVNAAVSRCRAL